MTKSTQNTEPRSNGGTEKKAPILKGRFGEDDFAPILIDLGKKTKKKVKQLREGRGPLMGTLAEAVAELKSHERISEDAHPVFVVVREKSKRRRWGW